MSLQAVAEQTRALRGTTKPIPERLAFGGALYGIKPRIPPLKQLGLSKKA